MSHTTRSASCRPVGAGLPRTIRAMLRPFAFVLLAASCADEPTATQTQTPLSASPAAAVALAADSGVRAQGTLPLPVNQAFSSVGVALRINQTGAGTSGNFAITNTANTSAAALQGTSNAIGAAVRGLMTGNGRAGLFEITNAGSTSNALHVLHQGIGRAVYGETIGRGGPAAEFVVSNGASLDPALRTSTAGDGNAVEATSAGSGSTVLGINYGIGTAGQFDIRSSGNGSPALVANTDGSGWAAKFSATSPGGLGVLISTTGGQGLQVIGGAKNAVVGTSDGARALYTEESTEVWFTDYGFGRLENGRAFIALDPTFAETVSLEGAYHVFVQTYGDADVYVARRTGTGFEVVRRSGDRQVEFSYRVVARRKGFEARRLERAPWADNDPGLALPRQ